MSKRKLDEQEKVVPAAEVSGEREEAFLHRWSRRKQEAQAREVEVAEQDAETAEPPAPQRVLTDADMPPIESLGEKSDFSVFLSSGVSEALRRRALRKLFLLPSINQRCPLDSEYHDCHGFEPLGNIITHEMREEMERAAQKLKEAAVSALVDDKNRAIEAPVDSQLMRLVDKELPPTVASASGKSVPSSPALLPEGEGRSNPSPSGRGVGVRDLGD